MEDYNTLLAKNREIILVETSAYLLGWDLNTYIPPGAIKQRGDQLAMLYQIRHRMLSSPDLDKLLKRLERKPVFEKLDEVQKRNVHLLRREVEEATALPEDLVAALAKQRAITVDIWKRAKAAKNWALFEPDLTKMIDLTKKRADILMKVRDKPTPYDALLDLFEPNMVQDTIATVFNELRQNLVPLADRCIKVSKDMDFSFIQRPIPIDVQRRIATEIAAFIEYDVTSDQAGGRIDETEHPFTTGYYDDVRITVHYYEDNFSAAFFGALHEGGHALYDQNYPSEAHYQSWGDASSYGIHESQSRFVENMVGRSPEFWKYFFPKLNRITNGVFKDITLDKFVQAVNRVERSKIRIEADEVTYSLHVIIRFEIERELFAGKIKIHELPSIWNEKYDEYLGVEIKHDSEGVMQDTHWASGYFGYFPSYALGNIYGGQFLTILEKDLPDWRNQIASGNFSKVKQWLVKHVHKKGNLYDPQDLVRNVTGESLNAKPFIKYIDNKFTKLFNL